MVKLTKELTEELCKYREEGLNVEDCAILVGISKASLYNWINKGRESKRKSRYRDFYNAWMRADRMNKAYHLRKINKDKSWQSSGWVLERRFPDEYSKPSRVEAKVEGDVKHTGEVTVNSTMELIRRFEEYYDEIESSSEGDNNSDGAE